VLLDPFGTTIEKVLYFQDGYSLSELLFLTDVAHRKSGLLVFVFYCITPRVIFVVGIRID
jgi:hypothetical protein